EEEEDAAVHPDALLRVEDWPARVELDERGDQQPQRREQDERGGGDRQIEGALQKVRARPQRLAEERDDGQRADLVDLGLARQRVEEARRDAELYAAPAPHPHHHVEEEVARK